jgi:hypothetical protein
MVIVGVLARFEVKASLDAEVAGFFKEGLPLVEAQPATTVWFAFRQSDTTHGAFPAFAKNTTERPCCPQAALNTGLIWMSEPDVTNLPRR